MKKWAHVYGVPSFWICYVLGPSGFFEGVGCRVYGVFLVVQMNSKRCMVHSAQSKRTQYKSQHIRILVGGGH